MEYICGESVSEVDLLHILFLVVVQNAIQNAALVEQRLNRIDLMVFSCREESAKVSFLYFQRSPHWDPIYSLSKM